jgi:serine protease
MGTGAENGMLDQVLGELAALRAENAAMRDENAGMREENQRLATRVDALDGQSSDHNGQLRASNADQPNAGDGDASDTVPGLSRRRLLTRLVGAGALGAGVLAVGDTFGPRAAQAASGDNMILGDGTNNSGADSTALSSTNGVETLLVGNDGTGSIPAPYAILATSKNGSGVKASAAVTGIVAIGGDYGVEAKGARAPLLLDPASGVGPPTSGDHLPGEIFLDANAALFQCVASGSPGTWVRVGFNPLNPTRIFDTRNTSPIGPNTSRNLAVGGAFGIGVPPQASAIVVNATVTRGTAPSFLTIYPEGTTKPSASNLNWVAGQTIPNLVTVKLGSFGRISIYNSAGSVDVILDLAGFYS